MDGSSPRNTLTLASAVPNPQGASGRLFLLEGNAAAGAADRITMAPGVTFPPAPGVLQAGSFGLRIIHFNDFHGQLLRFSQGGARSIVSRLAWHIAASRQQCQGETHCGVLALSAGDECGGSVFDLLIDSSGERVSHLYYRIYSELGVDAGCPGNHDFDRGLDFLESAVQAEAQFPMLAANVISTDDFTWGIYPGAIFVLKGVRVGLIGLVTRAENRLTEEEGRIVDPRPVARQMVDLLRPMCDVLVILTHLGRELRDHSVPMADCGDVELAQSLPAGAVDLIIGGHSHHALNQHGVDPENIVNGIPILQAGADGRFIGQADLQVNSDAVEISDARLVHVDDLPVDEEFEETVMQPWKQAAYSLLSRELGVVDYDGEESGSANIAFSSGEMALANLLTDGLAARMASRGEPVDFAMLDASALQSSVSQGEKLTYGDCFQMMPYHDTIRLYRITGAELYALLEDNALRLRYPDEMEYVERGFLQFSSALRYSIRLGRSRSSVSLRDAFFAGNPLENQMEREFTAAATCFTRELSSVWEADADPALEPRLFPLHRLPYRETDWVLRDEIAAYISEHGGITTASGARHDGRLKILDK